MPIQNIHSPTHFFKHIVQQKLNISSSIDSSRGAFSWIVNTPRSSVSQASPHQSHFIPTPPEIPILHRECICYSCPSGTLDNHLCDNATLILRDWWQRCLHALMETIEWNISNHPLVGSHTKSFYSPHNLAEGIFAVLTDTPQDSSNAFDWISWMDCKFKALFTLILIQLFIHISVFQKCYPQPLTKILLRGGYSVGFIAKVDQFMLHNSP